MTPAIRHHCWNHDAREAVCRCPDCSRSFCRECVTEHASRLLCASCLRKALDEAASRRRRTRGIPPALLLAGGILLSWSIFLILAGGVSELLVRMEQAAWPR